MVSGCSKNISINANNELTNSECEKQGGHVSSQQNEGTACKSGEIDLGRVNDIKCLCQCCKPN